MALDAGFEVAVGAEELRAPIPTISSDLLETVAEAGAFRLRLADTVGALDPLRTHEMVAPIVRVSDLAIEFHGHDDYGLATANTLAAVRAGATHASVTVGGLGERAGNACLAEVAAALESLHGLSTGLDLTGSPAWRTRSRMRPAAPFPRARRSSGATCSRTNSGIHVAGLLADPETYRGADPTLFGRRHRIVIGKHSGAKALAHALGECGVELPRRSLRGSFGSCGERRRRRSARCRSTRSSACTKKRAPRPWPRPRVTPSDPQEEIDHVLFTRRQTD